MVSTRQSSNVGSGGEGSGTELGHHGPSLSLRSVRSSLMNSDGSCPSSSNSNAVASSSSSNWAMPENPCQEVSVCQPKHDRGLLDMPPEILEKIFSYEGYQRVSQLRLVCKQLDQVCCNILNSTFQRLQTTMLNLFQTIRAKMPRRESARRNHPLACESDIVETLHMRLTLLQMTFGKHIERKHCCFFAGEILDEVYRILHYIKVTPKLSRPYKITDELFDLSSMAMEYFKEHIEPTLPEISCFGTDFLDFSKSFSANKNYLVLDSPPHEKDESPLLALPPPQQAADDMEPSVPQSNMVLRKRIRKIKQGMKSCTQTDMLDEVLGIRAQQFKYNSQLGLMRRDLRNCKSKIGEQQKLLLEYATRLDDNDKKNEETSRKFSTLLQELNKCKTELQFWRSKTVANPLFCQSCGKSVVPVANKDLQALAGPGSSSSQADAVMGVGGAPAPPFVFQGDVAPDNAAPADEDPFHSLWAADMNSTKEAMSACGSGTCRDPSVAAAATATTTCTATGTAMAMTSSATMAGSSSATCSAEGGVDPALLLSDSHMASTSTSTSTLAGTATNSGTTSRAASSATKRKASGDEPSADTVAFESKKLRRSTHSKLRATKRAAKV